MHFLKVRYSQKNIGDIFIAKQICCFTILNFVIWIFPPAWSVHSWHFQEACNPAKLFLLLELSTKDRTNVVSNKKKINIIGWFDILVNKVQDWDWDTTLYSNWTQFQNFNFKIVIWHKCLAIWNINLTFWKKATFRSWAIVNNYTPCGPSMKDYMETGWKPLETDRSGFRIFLLTALFFFKNVYY